MKRIILLVLILIAAAQVSAVERYGIQWDQYGGTCSWNGYLQLRDNWGSYDYTAAIRDPESDCKNGAPTMLVTTDPAACGLGGTNGGFDGCDAEPMTPEQCDELGLAYDGHAMACVDLEECPNGAFGDGSGSYTCLTDVTEPEEPNESDDPNTDNQCTSDSDDYKGVFNGKFYCNSNLPEAPTCKKGTSHIVDNGDGSYGFACAAMPESPDDAQDEDTETTSVIEDDDKKIERTVNSKTGAVTTKTTDKNTGDVTVTTTYPGIDSQTGEPCTEDSLYCYKSDQTGFCKDGNSLCEDVKDIKNWLTDGDGPGEGKDKGEFDGDEMDQKIADAKDKLGDQLDRIKSEFGQYFDFSPTAATLSCPYSFEVFGTDVSLCPDDYRDQLKTIGQLVMVLAAFIAFFLLARSDK